MKFDFTGKTAVITGAASGMGLLTAQKIAEYGGNAVLCDISLERAEQCAAEIREKGGKAIACETDVRQYADAEKAMKLAKDTFGSVDIVVTCAGGFEGRMLQTNYDFKQIDVAAIDWSLEVNLRGAIYFARAAMPYMTEQHSGAIVTLGSVDGVTGSGAGLTYSICKLGCAQLAKSLAIYGAPYGIRANCVSPGPVLTRPGMANMKTRLGRAAEPIEVVNLITYLCSDEAAFVTGANYVIDGGRSCGAEL